MPPPLVNPYLCMTCGLNCNLVLSSTIYGYTARNAISKMNCEEGLLELLNNFVSPRLVARHLGVSASTVYDRMLRFGIRQRFPRLDHVELRRRIEELRAYFPYISLKRMEGILGVSKTTVMRILRESQRRPVEQPVPPSERPTGSKEIRLRCLLNRMKFPRLVAAEMGLKVSTIYNMMEKYGVKLPPYNASQRRRAVIQMRQDMPGVSIHNLADLAGISRSTFSNDLRDQRIPPSPPLENEEPEVDENTVMDDSPSPDYEEISYDHESALAYFDQIT